MTTAGLLITLLFTSHTNASAQALPAGTGLIEAHYGFPNPSSFLKLALSATRSLNNLDAHGVGPIGARGEFMLSNRFGFGIEASYTKSKLTFTDNDHDYSVALQRIRVFPRLNFHFVQNTDVVDVYGAVGAGLHLPRYSFETTDPNFGRASLPGIIPVALRMALGFRAYAGPVGMGMEIGFPGGALINGGVTVRLR